MALSHNSTLADNEPDWGSWISENRSRLPDQAFADREERGFPHHWVRDGVGEDADGRWTEGEMYLHKAGLMAAFAAAMGARTGQKAGQDIIDHLEAHRRAIGMGEESHMASMVSTLRAIGDKGQADVRVLFDTGAGMSFVLRSVAEKLATFTKLPRPIRMILADGKTTATITESVNLIIETAGQQIMDTFIVLESALNDIILGEPTMRKFGLKIDLEHSVIFSEIRTEDKSMWKKFLAALGITVTDEPTEEKAVELVKSKIVGAHRDAPVDVASKGILTVLGLAEAASEDEVKGKILALRNRGDVVSREEHEKLLARMKESEIEQVIVAAMQGEEAKLTPAMKAGALQIAKDHGIDTLKSYVGALPKLGIFVKLPGKKEDTGAAAAIQVTAISKQLGVTSEVLAQYSTAEAEEKYVTRH